jgi:hypothetical protein
MKRIDPANPCKARYGKCSFCMRSNWERANRAGEVGPRAGMVQSPR